MPLREIAALCHRHGAEVCVDAIQAVGVVPLDVAAHGVDYLAAGSHKWLMGLEGAGFLYVRPDRVAALRPNVAGWLSHEDSATFLFEGAGHLRYDRLIRQRVDFLEFGAMNTVGFAALEAAVDILLELGVPQIFAHVSDFLDRLEQGVVQLGFSSVRSADVGQRSGILSVLPPAGGPPLGELCARLGAGGVACTTPDGLLRFAPHWPNDAKQVELVLEAVEAALAGPVE